MSEIIAGAMSKRNGMNVMVVPLFDGKYKILIDVGTFNSKELAEEYLKALTKNPKEGE